MRGFWLGLAIGTISTCILGPWVFSAASKETDPAKGISPETVADYVHSMIEAERTFYTTEVVERMVVVVKLSRVFGQPGDTLGKFDC